LRSQEPPLPPVKDHFSKQSKVYASSRPNYPRAIFEFIIGLVDEKNLAWDCATGNGQAAVVLAEYFKQVVASDISTKQIENAQRKNSNISYQIFPAEKTPFEDDSVDLVTIAQALHWFDFDRFYNETKRVLKRKRDGGAGSGKKKSRGGVIAAWAYGFHTISPEIDKVTHHLYEDILGDKYWPKERKYVESRYETIPFPFKQIPVPHFQIKLSWTMSELMNYFYSWSSVQKFVEKNNYDPISKIRESLEYAWGGKNHIYQKRSVVWPMYFKVGKL